MFTDRRKGREISRKRYLIAALATKRWGLTAKQLGELLGRRCEAVSRWASRGAEMRMRSREFRREYEALDESLAGRSLRSAAESQEG